MAWLAMLLAVWVVTADVDGSRLAATPPGILLLSISLTAFCLALSWLTDERRR